MILKKPALLFALTTILGMVAAKAVSRRPEAPKGYAVAEIDVTDPSAYKQYVNAVTPVVSHFGGKYLVRAGTVVPLEGEAPTGRFVIIEFPNLAAAKSFETSPEYRKIAPLRQKAARSRLFLVEGSPRP
jgi:uncharacterized protein (DUF1330 family)